MANEPIIVGPDRLIIQDGGRIERPPYECDSTTLRYKVKTTLVSRLLPKWGDFHPEHRELRKVSHGFVSEKGGWTILDCSYKGVIGEMPKVKITPGQVIASATLERLGLDGLAEAVATTLDIQFYSPTTTYEYYSKKKLKGPIFKGRIEWFQDSLEIINRRGTGRNRDQVFIFSGKSVALAKAQGGSEVATGGNSVYVRNDAYNGIAEVVTANFNPVPVAEGLWKVTEINQIQVRPFGFEPMLRMG